MCLYETLKVSANFKVRRYWSRKFQIFFLIEKEHYSEQKIVLRHISKMHRFDYINIFVFCLCYSDDTEKYFSLENLQKFT